MSKKTRVLLIILCALITATLRAEEDYNGKVVGEIVVSGNHNVKTRTVRSNIKLRIGHVLSEQALKDDISRLMATGFFEDVTVSVDDIADKAQEAKRSGGETLSSFRARPLGKVTYTVAEKPIIKRIDLKGNEKVSRQKLLDVITSQPSEGYERYKASSDEDAILRVYRDEGFAKAGVESYVAKDTKTNKVILTFFITEGERILVNKIIFSGNESYKSSKLAKLMKTRRRKVLKDDVLRADSEKIERFYKNHGYITVAVSTPAVAVDTITTKADIGIEIAEGPKYKVGDVQFDGYSIYKEEELRKAVTLKTKEFFKQDKLDESQRRLQDLYADKGYLRANIISEKELLPDLGLVKFTFKIEESHAVYVDKIYVDGYTYTKEKVFRREVLLKEGEIFSASKIRRSVEQIYNLGFLDDVQVDIQQPKSPEMADVVFTVKEGKPGMLSAGAAFSSVDGLLGTMQLQHMNLFGRGQRLNLLWEFGKKKQNYEIGWTERWFMDKPMSFGVDVFNTERFRPFGTDTTAYKEGRKGGGLRLGPRLSDTLSLLFTYNYESISVFDIDPAHLSNIQPSDSITSSFASEVIYDNRDNVFDATRGNRNTAAIEVAGGIFGGNVDYYKPQFTSSWYFPTFWKFVFSVSARGGAVREFAPSKDVPISEKFLVGGADTVRGYNLGEIGPPEGGKVMLILNAEYKFPIVQEQNRTILQGAFFVDAGGAWRRLPESRLKIDAIHENYLKAGWGFGLRFKTPVFPIRLDWGYGLNHKPGEQKTQFYFTIGNLF